MGTKIISVYTQKGGAGKTTTSWLLGEALTYCSSAEKEIKVLCIDNDRQRNLTITLLSEEVQKEHKESLLNVLKDGAPISENILTTRFSNLHIVPASSELDSIEVKGHELKKALDPFVTGEFKDYYDFIIIDNNPSMKTGLNTASLLAADTVLVPYLPELYGFKGLVDSVRYIKDTMKHLQIIIVPVRVKNTSTAFAYVNAAMETFPELITNSKVPEAQEVETIKTKKGSLFMKTKSKVADAILDLIEEKFNYSKMSVETEIARQRTKRKKEQAISNLSRARKVNMGKRGE